VSGIGKKKAERIALDLADKVADLAIVTPVVDGVTGGAQNAVQALVNLGYSFSVADTAVRAVLEEDGVPDSTEELVRRALSAT
jgi:Holliday junction DNA helicase RuvA